MVIAFTIPRLTIEGIVFGCWAGELQRTGCERREEVGRKLTPLLCSPGPARCCSPDPPRPERGAWYVARREVKINGGLMRKDLLFQIMKSKRPGVMEKLLSLKRWIIMGNP